MPYRNIAFAMGGHYHIYNRGVAKQPIFLEPVDYALFTDRLAAYAERLQITIIAYCLLPNHYHLFVCQDGNEPAGKLPQYVCNGYSKGFNRRHGRRGTLFQGRFGARLIVDQVDAQHLCAYIHGNPVVAGLVKRAQDWPYSDLRSWLTLKGPSRAKRNAMESLFINQAEYKRFLEDVIEQKMYKDDLNF